ncbi:MAG TPA: hypothetical protein VJ850_09620 [Candidatus Limnocylindrales bacterium]|nr:hypothetical protein [Candidatus Limnocylindrales bacterium]
MPQKLSSASFMNPQLAHATFDIDGAAACATALVAAESSGGFAAVVGVAGAAASAVEAVGVGGVGAVAGAVGGVAGAVVASGLSGRRQLPQNESSASLRKPQFGQGSIRALGAMGLRR